jgi:hypothetical protein
MLLDLGLELFHPRGIDHFLDTSLADLPAHRIGESASYQGS